MYGYGFLWVKPVNHSDPYLDQHFFYQRNKAGLLSLLTSWVLAVQYIVILGQRQKFTTKNVTVVSRVRFFSIIRYTLKKNPFCWKFDDSIALGFKTVFFLLFFLSDNLTSKFEIPCSRNNFSNIVLWLYYTVPKPRVIKFLLKWNLKKKWKIEEEKKRIRKERERAII